MAQETHELVGGPQDGAKVTGQSMPQVIYVGPRWMGDGFASWGREKCDRFPIRYIRWERYCFAPEPSTVPT